jgi:hypothetical protein
MAVKDTKRRIGVGVDWLDWSRRMQQIPVMG